ncbi:LLM class F420-dependent oxidoreductase [Mycobacterium sp. Aquia_216]|uniref:LLM class F420-dependent oxidoreductase n=1 Tax=Mycobacterium sp. Aquia_216 TaxID=2991729 RepID=UPI00227B8A66|nr:LLM class F420-dependent oxidoreductase [Mycobacterium sp. Aquia_216]WAJ46227.1 LLM class F420-dependent oxidoreductase [Mycobacterium sp. Aquia_216]
MSTPETNTVDLGRFGYFGLAATPEQAREIERLGYGTIWVGGSPPAELSFVEPLLESTNALKVATGIVNIWTAAAKPVAESFHRINTAYPGRFILGVGVGHPEAQAQYRKPYEALVSYLDELDDYGVPAAQRVLAALGPRVLRLSAERSAGAHPANATPEHAARARAIIGPNALLAPVHNVVLTAPGEQGAEEARAIGRNALEHYFNLTNYVSNWKRLGFTDADIAAPGSDKLIDAVIAHGTPESIATRLGEYLSAGADHVAILVHGGPERVLPTLSELAGPLGLSG